jgi:hypothetical protein
MSRRMKEVKSVLNFNRHSPSHSSEFSRRLNNEKKHEQTNNQLR